MRPRIDDEANQKKRDKETEITWQNKGLKRSRRRLICVKT